jgi:hypothetical protein
VQMRGYSFLPGSEGCSASRPVHACDHPQKKDARIGAPYDVAPICLSTYPPGRQMNASIKYPSSPRYSTPTNPMTLPRHVDPLITYVSMPHSPSATLAANKHPSPPIMCAGVMKRSMPCTDGIAARTRHRDKSVRFEVEKDSHGFVKMWLHSI